MKTKSESDGDDGERCSLFPERTMPTASIHTIYKFKNLFNSCGFRSQRSIDEY
jgi:hypothetical protein